MNRKEKVLAYIKSKEYIPLKFNEIASVLSVPSEDIYELSKILDTLVLEGNIRKTKTGRYEAVRVPNGLVGTIACSSAGFYGFLIPDEEGEEDVYIRGEYLNGALDKDKVLVRLLDNKPCFGKREGKVIKVLNRNTTTISGVVKRAKGGMYEVKPDSAKIFTTIKVRQKDMMGADILSRVLVTLTEFFPTEARGIVTKVLGDSGDLKTNIESLLFCDNTRTEFDEATVSYLENIPDKVSDADLAGRCDFRDLLTFTIDGDDARDFDDAVSLEPLKNGNMRLGVHIADVTHYVKEASPLDNEAYIRGTSIYLPDRVIPMLPKKLSNGICSLNPHVDRLTLSIMMEIDKSGNVLSYELLKSVIHSKYRMTYSDTARILENPDGDLAKEYSELLPTLKAMKSLAKILNKRRMARGSIDFDFPESKIITNEQGIPEDIIPETREVSHKIIEEFMLIANETVAEYAFFSELPFVYRVHEPPSEESIRDFQHFISAFGLGLKGTISKDKPITPSAMQEVLLKSKGMDEESMISEYALRSLMKAEYKPENLGHFGLAAKYYCHFTSPIRRYPDLLIHRILKAFIDGKSTDNFKAFSIDASRQSSEAERKAENLERDVSDLMKAYYMSQYIGYIFEGKISSVTDFGVFVRLTNSVEGLITIESLNDDYYVYDSVMRKLVGRHTGKVYKIGDFIDIAVARCDLLTRRIDFIPAENATMSDIDDFQKRAHQRMVKKEKRIKGAFRERKSKFKGRRRRNG